MSHETGSDQSKNVCLSILHEDDYYNGGNRLTRELSSRVLGGANVRSSASTSDGASKKHIGSATQVHLFATVLEDILMQLRILDESNNEMHLYKMQFIMNELLEKKFGVESVEHEDELLPLDLKNLENDSYKLCKHAADRNTCITVLTNTYLGLIQDGTYEALIKYKQEVDDKLDHYLFLIDEETRNKDMRRNLRRQVRQQRIRIKSNVYEANQIVEELVARLEDEAVHRNTQERYVEKWESARTEQNNMRIHDTESSFSNTITKYNNKVDDEQRVHSEVENIINVTVCETLKKIEECMSKYDKDMEALEFKITIMRLNYEKQAEQRLELEQKFAEHEVELKNFTQFKEDREKIRAYQVKMNTAAVVVQAWWRGILVRQELGPFKPSLEKKKRNKKKKK